MQVFKNAQHQDVDCLWDSEGGQEAQQWFRKVALVADADCSNMVLQTTNWSVCTPQHWGHGSAGSLIPSQILAEARVHVLLILWYR